MGLIDILKPVPDLNCPNCQAVLTNWQSTHKDCCLFIWQQGTVYPIEQMADEDCAISENERMKVRLPQRFDLYTSCENCPDYWIVAEGKTENGVWTIVENLRLEKMTKLPRKWFNQEEKKR